MANDKTTYFEMINEYTHPLTLTNVPLLDDENKLVRQTVTLAAGETRLVHMDPGLNYQPIPADPTILPRDPESSNIMTELGQFRYTTVDKGVYLTAPTGDITETYEFVFGGVDYGELPLAAYNSAPGVPGPSNTDGKMHFFDVHNVPNIAAAIIALPEQLAVYGTARVSLNVSDTWDHNQPMCFVYGVVDATTIRCFAMLGTLVDAHLPDYGHGGTLAAPKMQCSLLMHDGVTGPTNTDPSGAYLPQKFRIVGRPDPRHPANTSLATDSNEKNPWQKLKSLKFTRHSMNQTVLDDGTVLIAGGSESSRCLVQLPMTEIFDPKTLQTRQVGDMITPRFDSDMVMLASVGPQPFGPSPRKALIAGGFGRYEPILTPTATSELFDPATGEWSAAGKSVFQVDQVPASAPYEITLTFPNSEGGPNVVWNNPDKAEGISHEVFVEYPPFPSSGAPYFYTFTTMRMIPSVLSGLVASIDDTGYVPGFAKVTGAVGLVKGATGQSVTITNATTAGYNRTWLIFRVLSATSFEVQDTTYTGGLGPNANNGSVHWNTLQLASQFLYDNSTQKVKFVAADAGRKVSVDYTYTDGTPSATRPGLMNRARALNSGLWAFPDGTAVNVGSLALFDCCGDARNPEIHNYDKYDPATGTWTERNFPHILGQSTPSVTAVGVPWFPFGPFGPSLPLGVTYTGLHSIRPDMVGQYLTVSGMQTMNNNGIYKITEVLSSTSVTVANNWTGDPRGSPDVEVGAPPADWQILPFSAVFAEPVNAVQLPDCWDLIIPSGISTIDLLGYVTQTVRYCWLFDKAEGTLQQITAIGGGEYGDEATLENISGLGEDDRNEGSFFELFDMTNPLNNGTFKIVKYLSPTSCIIQNAQAVLDAGSGTWKGLGWMRVADTNMGRGRGFVAALPDGRVITGGGATFATSDDDANANIGSDKSCEIYDPKMDMWTFTGPLNGQHTGNWVAVTQEGEVFLHGAFLGGSVQETGGFEQLAEMYNPTTGQWRVLPKSPSGVPIVWYRPTVLADGRIFMAGGVTNGREGNWLESPTDAAYLFCPPK